LRPSGRRLADRYGAKFPERWEKRRKIIRRAVQPRTALASTPARLTGPTSQRRSSGTLTKVFGPNPETRGGRLSIQGGRRILVWRKFMGPSSFR
jgi:hypothetical protein